MEEFDPAVFAENVRSLRLRFDLSIRDLAKRAGIDKQTLLRIEQGRSANPRTRERVARALGSRIDRLSRRPTVSGPGFVAHKREDDFWIETTTKRQILAADEVRWSEEVQSAAERLRLGKLGFVQTFTRPLLSAVPDGSFAAGVLELYGFPTPAVTPVEIFAYCLRGPVIIRLGDTSTILETDESMTIAPGVTGAWGPAKPLGENELPPLLLYVNAKRGLTE